MFSFLSYENGDAVFGDAELVEVFFHCVGTGRVYLKVFKGKVDKLGLISDCMADYVYVPVWKKGEIGVELKKNEKGSDPGIQYVKYVIGDTDYSVVEDGGEGNRIMVKVPEGEEEKACKRIRAASEVVDAYRIDEKHTTRMAKLERVDGLVKSLMGYFHGPDSELREHIDEVHRALDSLV